VIPAARIAAAIEILDRILAGTPAEPALSGWARGNRYAGSGDRAAIRDHVFDALRCRRSLAARGGAETGRGLMLGALRAAGADPAEVFTGARFAPAPLGPQDGQGRLETEMSEAERVDCPDWLWPVLQEDLGAQAGPVMAAQQARAPVFLRCALSRGSRDAAMAALAEDGIETAPHPEVATALIVTAGARRLRQTKAYDAGLVELQDAAPQAAMAALPICDGDRVLDYCAGGGGKILALGDRAGIVAHAHDADAGRMSDLPARAARAGLKVTCHGPGQVAGQFDLVLCDVPCSGSGTWRRTPDAKWRLTAAELARLEALQVEILDRAADLVAPGGTLAYATCSVLTRENAAQVAAFTARTPGWRETGTRQWWPGPLGDGFFLATLSRIKQP